ncbi:MAG: CotS family spore coat protein [Bacillota bacterium]
MAAPAAAGPMRALAEYGVAVIRLRRVTRKRKRAVWEVTTSEGGYALKELAVPPRRVRFLAAAHEHLHGSGLVPALRRTRTRLSFVDGDEARYTLYGWVDGRRPSLSRSSDLRLAFSTAGRFHAASHGFRAPADSNPRDYLGAWPVQYEERISRASTFAAAARRRDRPADRVFLDALPVLLGRAETARRRLDGLPYPDRCRRWREESGFCHQDFAPSNMVVTESGPVVFDLDRIAVDLPVRDLRKLLNRVFIHLGSWDERLAGELLGAYRRERDLAHEDLELLAVDLLFPHLFMAEARERYEYPGAAERESLCERNMVRAVTVELSKPASLRLRLLREGAL